MLTETILQQKDRHGEPETWYLVPLKVDAWKGKRKIKDRWEEGTWEVVHQIVAGIPSYKVTNQHGWSQVLHQN